MRTIEGLDTLCAARLIRALDLAIVDGNLWLNKKMRIFKSILASLSLLLMMTGAASAAVESRKVDEISMFNWEDLMARLDFYAIELQKAPASSGYIIVYDGRLSRRGEAQAWTTCIKNYLVERRGMDASRIKVMNGGYREKITVEMWLALPADSPPKATPTIKPKDVKYRKGSLKKKNWRSLCNI